MKSGLQRWKLAEDVKVIGTEEEIKEAQELAEGSERLIAMELRARREIRNRLIASGLPDAKTGLSTVPWPTDLVDLDEAWTQSQVDLKQCEWQIDNQPSFLNLCAAHLNTVQWAKFWANQHPNREWRKRFERAAIEGTMQQDYVLARFKEWEA